MLCLSDLMIIVGNKLVNTHGIDIDRKGKTNVILAGRKGAKHQKLSLDRICFCSQAGLKAIKGTKNKQPTSSIMIFVIYKKNN